ncbi:nucleotidyltransferase family protein [Sulfobacillus thermosulfidooxidans]|uniref:nucleotidyltransferase family protein n=1 Tax=Sulfobacillus thermosulfidooxidans TaxID=28034 RepID=UPI0003F6C6EA|nr:nucleotidyltransferase domain-containing protein [Sulfobacillus thermosulfidooxidans]
MPPRVDIPEHLPISIDPNRLTILCRRYGIRELALFGSVLRDDFTSQSDIDVLYDVEPTSPIRSLFDVGRLVVDLEELLGRRVDVANKQRLYPVLRDEILSTRRVIYAET